MDINLILRFIIVLGIFWFPCQIHVSPISDLDLCLPKLMFMDSMYRLFVVCLQVQLSELGEGERIQVELFVLSAPALLEIKGGLRGCPWFLLTVLNSSDCTRLWERKRCLLLGRKVMTNIDSILKSRDITLPTKVCLVKAVVFPVVR